MTPVQKELDSLIEFLEAIIEYAKDTGEPITDPREVLQPVINHARQIKNMIGVVQ